MKKHFYYLILAVLTIAALVMPGCIKITTQHAASSLLSEATLATAVGPDGKPLNVTNTFYVNTPSIFCSIKLNDAPVNTQLKIKWNYIKGDAANLVNSTLREDTITKEGSQYLTFEMPQPAGGWPGGDYTAVLYLNGNEQVSVPFTVQNLQAPASWPTINSFSAIPTAINLGQAVTLSWDVSNATRVTIQPVIGSVTANGTRAVQPNINTTYTLTATNDVGTTSNSLSVIVTSTSPEKPDLVITDFWLQGLMMYYKIKNMGGVLANPSNSFLFVDGLHVASSFVDILAAGQERTHSFSNYQWPFGSPDAGGGYGGYTTTINDVAAFQTPYANPHDPSLQNHIVKVCADGKDEVLEADEINNCMTQNWGILFKYDFTSNAHLAEWVSGAGPVSFVPLEEEKRGAAFRASNVIAEDGANYSNVLEMVPEQVSGGWIQGKFGDFYVDQNRSARVRAIIIPNKTKLVAKVGFTQRAQGSDGAKFVLGLVDQSGMMTFLPGLKVNYDGQLHTFEVDLNDYVGEAMMFILRVEAGNSAALDYAIWTDVRLEQLK